LAFNDLLRLNYGVFSQQLFTVERIGSKILKTTFCH